MSEHGYLKFTGKYAELKNMGYTFCKLYAANYMSWNKNNVFIFKKGSDITHGNIDLYKFIKFMNDKPVVLTSRRGGISFYKFYTNADTNEYEYHAVTDENRNKYRENMDQWGKYDGTGEAPEYMSMEHVSVKLIELLRELKEKGWYELAIYDESD